MHQKGEGERINPLGLSIYSSMKCRSFYTNQKSNEALRLRISHPRNFHIIIEV
jgi:hypothetical protein